jgi:hypothetical protein
MPLGALVVNRVHRVAPVPEVPAAALRRLERDGADGRLLATLLEQHQALETLAATERRRIAGLAETAPDTSLVEVPLLADDVHDIPGLRRLGAHLFAAAEEA